MLTLTGCRSGDRNLSDALNFRTKLLGSNGCTFTCHVDADYGDGVHSFSMDCDFEGESCSFTITAPDSIRGISAKVEDDGSELSFEDLRLEYGTLANGYVAPLTAPWIIASAWTEGYIDHAGRDGEDYVLVIRKGYDKEELTVISWLRHGVPVHAEVLYQGEKVLTVKIENFSYR